MKISIITVCYNSANWIKQSIESVINQDYKDIEYIIIDGNSQDDTKKIIENYSDRITRFISEPDHGIYNAMNKGIKIASGDYIYFLGSDDYLIDNQVISNAVDFINKNPKYEFIYGNIEVRSSKAPAYIHKPSSPAYVLEELICGCLPHQASLAHSSLFCDQKIGLFSERYKSASDYGWFVKLAEFATKTGNELGYYDRVFASYNAEGTSSDIENALTEMFDIQNNAPIYQEDSWLRFRIDRYQKILISPNGHWGINRTKIDNNQINDLQKTIVCLQEETSKSQAQIEAMKSSKFWKLRTLWFKFRRKTT